MAWHPFLRVNVGGTFRPEGNVVVAVRGRRRGSSGGSIAEHSANRVYRRGQR